MRVASSVQFTDRDHLLQRSNWDERSRHHFESEKFWNRLFRFIVCNKNISFKIFISIQKKLASQRLWKHLIFLNLQIFDTKTLNHNHYLLNLHT